MYPKLRYRPMAPSLLRQRNRYPNIAYRIPALLRETAIPIDQPCQAVSPRYYDLLAWFNIPIPDYSFITEPETRERKIDQVLEQLKQGVSKIQDSAVFRDWLLTMAKFHEYSLGNQILIMLQKPTATRVAGFYTWKDLGRWVKAGEKGVAILAPCLAPRELACPLCSQGSFTEKTLRAHIAESHPGANITEVIRQAKQEAPPAGMEVTYFKVVYVFDISQTSGKELPVIEVPPLTGAANQELFDKALALAKSEGVDVSFEPRPELNPEIKGSYIGKDIWVKPDEAPAQQLKTLLHELCHYYTETVFGIPRRDAETIAESSAFSIAAHFGFDTGTRSFPYVATWAADKKVLEQNMGAIRRVTAKVIPALETTPAKSLLQEPREPIYVDDRDYPTSQEDKRRIAELSETFKYRHYEYSLLVYGSGKTEVCTDKDPRQCTVKASEPVDIWLHNHPGGIASPSLQDRLLARDELKPRIAGVYGRNERKNRTEVYIFRSKRPEKGITPEVTLSTGKVVPVEPVEAGQSAGIRWMERIQSLDKQGVLDNDYRSILSTANKGYTLKKGETWRSRALRYAEDNLKRHPVIPEKGITPEVTEFIAAFDRSYAKAFAEIPGAPLTHHIGLRETARELGMDFNSPAFKSRVEEMVKEGTLRFAPAREAKDNILISMPGLLHEQSIGLVARRPIPKMVPAPIAIGEIPKGEPSMPEAGAQGPKPGQFFFADTVFEERFCDVCHRTTLHGQDTLGAWVCMEHLLKPKVK